jgi:2-polyprenyl-6-methoxyphenol hydroxylase-like FAD-dependent oxidoreductase
MSPVGGVGINYAIHDAVAAANILVPAFRRGIPFEGDLAEVQARRESPARRMQRLQVFMHRRILAPVLHKNGHIKVPWFLKLANSIPALRYIPARIIGLGFGPEHVEIDF